MTTNFEILTNFIKDMSSETPDLKTYLHVKDKIPSYQLNIQINTKPLKNRMIEVNTLLSFSDKEQSEIKSYFSGTISIS